MIAEPRTVPRETPDPIAVALAFAIRRAVARRDTARAERRATMTVVDGGKATRRSAGMRLLTRTHLERNRYELTVELEPTEPLALGIGEVTGELPGMGLIRVVGRRRMDPQPWLLPTETVLVVEVETLETVGRLPNL